MDKLAQRRVELLEEIGTIERLRRGQLSEQYIEKPGADGELKRYGPYYVWQASIRGKKRSHRIGSDHAEEVREELAAYQQYQKLCEELADVTEKLTCRKPPPANSKKKPLPPQKLLGSKRRSS